MGIEAVDPIYQVYQELGSRPKSVVIAPEDPQWTEKVNCILNGGMIPMTHNDYHAEFRRAIDAENDAILRQAERDKWELERRERWAKMEHQLQLDRIRFRIQMAFIGILSLGGLGLEIWKILREGSR